MIFKKIILLCFALTLASCGSSQTTTDDDVTPPKIDNDCAKFVPEGFVLEKQLDGCGFTMATARKGENVCPRVIIIVKDGKLVRISKEIICKSIDFGDEVVFCESISREHKGAVLEFTMAGDTQDDRFLKIIDDVTMTDIPVSLKEGFVPKDFSDINADGYNELIIMDNRWFGLKPFEKKTPPFTQKIAVYRDGKFVDETSRFTNYLEGGVKYWSSQAASAKSELESVNAAVILALIYRDLGKENEGINLMEKIIKTASSKELVETVKYFLQEYKKKDKNPDWFYPARKLAWEPIPWQQTKSP
jgi:hypothetical protein